MHEQFIHGIADAAAGGRPLIGAVKEYLRLCHETLRADHLGGAPGSAVCAAYTRAMDELLRTLFRIKAVEAGCSEPVSLIALGGYGRGELNIRSDIDLMLLYRKRIAPSVEEMTEKALYVLWDTGLDMGFCVRSLDECIDLARTDLKTFTALLDRRLVHGDRPLFDLLGEQVGKKLLTQRGVKAFINDKVEETRQRHEKYGGSVYILEPNVKEGEGGLRDYHTAAWLLKARGIYGGIEAAVPALISADGVRAVREALDSVLWVRNELHFHTGRKYDQLTFDQQERLAALLGFKAAEHALAVEQFMQSYYRKASDISHHSGLMISRARRMDRKPGLWPARKTEIDSSFVLSDGHLSLRDPAMLEDEPALAVKAFELSASLGAEIEPATKDAMMASESLSGERFTTSKEAASSFLRLLSGKKGVYGSLSEMHAIRLLDKYVPEFSEIRCRVQHDRYHIYTVDVHTLFAVRELERLRGQSKFDSPVLANVYESLDRQDLLMLAVLFHDIGKGRGKGHAERGAEMASAVCSRLGLPPEEARLVRFLVANHLVLANTAQYRDIHDERLIIEFARKMGDVERLSLLYLLTYADVRAVGPDVWTDWKAALFQELYFKALTVLERGSFEAEDAAERVKALEEKVAAILGAGPEAPDTAALFALLPTRYLLSNGPERVAGHLRTLSSMGSRPCVMSVAHDEYRNYTELVICTHDMPGLFSMIAGVMAANSVDILGAQVNTLKNGLVLDVLQVVGATGSPITDRHKLERIEEDLNSVVTGVARVAALVARRKPSILDGSPRPRVRTSVQVDNEVSDAYTVFDIHANNRIGLLYDITSTLAANGFYIHVAKIVTKGDEAADVFYVKDIFGQKVFFKEKLDKTQSDLMRAIAEKEPAQAAAKERQ